MNLKGGGKQMMLNFYVRSRALTGRFGSVSCSVGSILLYTPFVIVTLMFSFSFLSAVEFVRHTLIRHFPVLSLTGYNERRSSTWRKTMEQNNGIFEAQGYFYIS